MINPEIFREYDIRGVAERDLSGPVVIALGRAYGEYLRPKGVAAVTVGHDARLSSPRLRDALMEGIVSSGMNAVDIGLCPTPALYYSLYNLKPGAGVMITGSHNPPEFNGFKLCVGTETIYGSEIQELHRIMEAMNNKGRVSYGTGHKRGTITRHMILPDYVNFLKQQFQDKKEISLKVVLDAGNGTAGLAAPEIIREMGCEVVELFSEPDGNFPNHHPDPTIPENLSVLINKVRSEKADIGIAFDGDSDRIGVVDERGGILWGDQLMVIFSRDILRERPGAAFVSEVKCSQAMYDDIRMHGGNAIMWKTGHSLIKAKMKETGAVMAGEMSGHLFFADRYFGYDDAIYAACRIIEILKKLRMNKDVRDMNNRTISDLSDLLSDLPETYNTPEIRIDCPDNLKFRVVESIKEIFQKGENSSIAAKEVITVDGIRVVFRNGWGLIRASNTQPVLVMRFEARDQKTLIEIRTTMESILKGVIQGLKA